MAQVSKYPLSDKVYQQVLKLFFRAIVGLKNEKEVEEFFADFLTPTEKIVLAKRLAIFVMLAKGYDYRTIRNTLKVSPPTIASVSMYYKYLGHRCKKVVEKILKDEKMQEFWQDVAEKLTSSLADSKKEQECGAICVKRLKKRKRRRFSEQIFK